MTKKEAIELMVSRDFSAVPEEWVKIVAEAKNVEIYAWPMWGTMWLVDDFIGKKLMANSQRMVGEASEIDLDAIDDEKRRAEVEEAIKALEEEKISWGETALLDEYINEEMAGADNIKDTAAYIYEIDGQYVVGINGAGWNFYGGVWDRLYDILGLKWHEEEITNPDHD